MQCPTCNQAINSDWAVCPYCQTSLQRASSNNPYAQPMAIPTAELLQPSESNNPDLSGLIPYKNPKALIAYYVSIAGALPIIGFPFALTAFVLGIMGLKDRKKNPKIKGSVHAWIGIGCGGLFSLIWFAMVAIMILGFVLAP